MITLLASIAGFISSIIPEIVKYFKDANDKKHELAILDKQIQYNQTAASRSLEEIHISRDIQEQASLYATYKTEITWVDAVNGLVRPVLAYSFFIMYMVVKYLQYAAISRTSHVIEYIEIIWSTDDQAIFAGIISFYYGQRTFQKLWKNQI
jgi:Holin of 3TMs, for gene-transfer release